MAARKDVIHAQGKRKLAIARATLTPGTGKVTVNGLYLHNYGTDLLRTRISEPLVLAGDATQKLNFEIRVQGGGINGQADAVRLAIARALVEHQPKLEKTFDHFTPLHLLE